MAGGTDPKGFAYLAQARAGGGSCVCVAMVCGRADAACPGRSQSSTHTLTKVSDSDEFERLKSSLSAFDLGNEARGAWALPLPIDPPLVPTTFS